MVRMPVISSDQLKRKSERQTKELDNTSISGFLVQFIGGVKVIGYKGKSRLKLKGKGLLTFTVTYL